jgi:hypothetical protein
VARKPKGPGLRKTRGLPLLHERSVALFQSSDYGWREIFESADVMSEGATRSEPEGKTYYGSTSVLLPFRSNGGRIPDADADQVAKLLAHDPHARLRAVRIACVEAQVRSVAPIGRVRAELCVRRVTRGIRVDVDVEAKVFEHAARPARKAEGGAKRSRAS